MVVGVHPKRRSREPPVVTLRIERFRERVRLSGDLRSEDLDQVKTEIERCGTSAVLDVEEVALVDLDGVQFLKPLLQAEGLRVTSVGTPLTSFADDVAATKRSIAAEDGPV